MPLIWDGLSDAIRLIQTGDPEVVAAALRSIWISVVAVTFASAIGLPLGAWLARFQFRGNRLVVLAFRAAMALPTVFIGVVCYAFFSRRGPLGPLELLYSPWGIAIGELILALPIVVGISHGAIKSLDPRVAETAWTLGASPIRRLMTYFSEARVGVMLAVLTAFSRCVTELGIAMLVGGNIKYRTRTLSTATALEIGKGEFARGLAMGVILLVIALTAACLIGWISREDKR